MRSNRPTILVGHPGAELYGSDRVLLESVVAIRERGWRAVVALPERGPLVAALLGAGAEVVIVPTAVVRKSVLTPRGAMRFVRDALRNLGSARRLLRRTGAAGVYVNTITIPVWTIAARLSRTPVLTHVHEGESRAPRPLRAALALPLTLSSRIIANSAFSIGVLSRTLPAVARRIVLVPNGVPGPEDPVPPRRRVDAPRICYVGRLSPRKGVDVAIDALAELRRRGVDARLDLVGAVFRGYEWYESALREQTERLGLEEHVVFHGFVDPVWPVIAAADIVVVPSRFDEPFGDTAVEAVLARRPVIASATSGLLEATAGYPTATTVEAGNAGALADGVVDVIGSWPSIRERTEQARAMALERHGPGVYRSAVARVVAEMVSA